MSLHICTCVYLFHVCVSPQFSPPYLLLIFIIVHEGMCIACVQCPQRSGEAIRLLRTDVADGCEPPDAGAGNQAWILWKSSKCFYQQAVSPSTLLFIYLFILRQGLSTEFGTQVFGYEFTCLCFPRTGITGIHHHAWAFHGCWSLISGPYVCMANPFRIEPPLHPYIGFFIIEYYSNT